MMQKKILVTEKDKTLFTGIVFYTPQLKTKSRAKLLKK